MYEKFYGFKENPFAMTPDPKFFFPSQKHTEALDSLIYTVAEKRGFAVVTGEIGSGKTTVCRTLLNRLDTGTKVAMITNTYLRPRELLSYILEELGVTFDGGEKSNLLSCLKKFLVEQLYLDFNVVLIIDEAQNLNLNVLEEIRMLSNLETEKEKMIQIILTGQPVLKDKLQSKELAQLSQRVNVQYHIPPLNRIDSERYINHRLDVASINGNRQVEFTTEAMDKIYAHSQGIPRAINMVCNNALLIGYVIEAKQITPQIIKEATEEFQNETKIDIDKAIVSIPLNEQLNQHKKDKEEVQLQEKTLQLKDLTHRLQTKQDLWEKLKQNFIQLKQELGNLQEQKHKSQQELLTRQSQLKETETQLNQKNSELETTETQLNQKDSELKTLTEETKAKQSQLKEAETKLEELNAQLEKVQKELRLFEAGVSKKQTELGALIEDVNRTQKEFWELEEQKRQSQQELLTKQSQLQETETQLKQLNEQLNRLKKGKEEAQLQQAKLDQEWLKRQKEWEGKKEGASKQLQATESRLKQLNEELKKVQEENSQLKLKQETVFLKLKASQEELDSYVSTIAGKLAELDQINKSLESSQKDLSTTESKCQQKYSELEQVTLQLDNAKKKFENLEELILDQTQKLTEKLQSKGLQANGIDNAEAKLHCLEKLARGLTEKPVIKLKAKHPKAEAAFLTAYTFNGEIKINQMGNDDFLNSVYSGIQIFHQNRDMGNYKNFIFSAKGNRQRDYSTVFRVELKNGTMKMGKHYKVEVADSWQKVNIPLAEFSKITNLNSVSEVSLFIDNDVMEPDRVIYINDICFSN